MAQFTLWAEAGGNVDHIRYMLVINVFALPT